MIEVETTATSEAESVHPSCQSSAETAESQSDVDPSEDVCTPVLLEDPLILNSPRVTIPKKKSTLEHNCPQPPNVPSVSKNPF